MTLTLWQYLGVILAVAAICLGGLTLFSDKFLAFMHRTTWRRTSAHGNRWFSNEREASKFDRYGTGLGFLIGGIILLMMSLIKLFK
jgi:hypothetical protein